jgi:poly(hydroxyalkanoate) depolymerase family esterase
LKIFDLVRQRLKRSAINQPLQTRSQTIAASTPTILPFRRSTPDAKGVGEVIERALAQAGLLNRRSAEADAAPELPLRSRVRPDRDAPSANDATSGTFTRHVFGNAAGTRAYALYVPASYAETSVSVPLVIMLHGCTQSPEDFAAGTRMNEFADARGFLVVYPEQPARANGSRCWNWFSPNDQQRDRGEPSIIAGIVNEVARNFRIDRARIFVAGLSAGAAMAVVLGETYPDLFAAVGAHSGLPFAAAHDVPSAFAAMRQANAYRTGGAPVASNRSVSADSPRTIVFHGDSDSTVNVLNGLAIEADALRTASDARQLRNRTEQGRAPSGRLYTRTTHVDEQGCVRVERWILGGSGHEWSGGSASGSFTEPGGVDASREMIRFFGA